MRDYLTIGSSPISEDCIQVSDKVDYYDAMRKECRKFVVMLYEVFPDVEEHNCSFKTKTFQHDFGSYTEAVVMFDDEDEDSAEYAEFVERYTPDTWGDLEPRNYDQHLVNSKFNIKE